MDGLAAKVGIELTHDDSVMPVKAHPDDACFDVFSREKVVMHCGETHVIPLGFRLNIPKGYKMCLVARSGLASKGIIVSNAPAQIDSGFEGEVCLLLRNTTKDSMMKFGVGAKLGQMYLERVLDFDFVEYSDSTNPRGGGLGSTGV